MKKLREIIWVVSMGFAIAKGDSASMNEGFNLSPSELVHYQGLAEQGDAEASARLSRYDFLYKSDAKDGYIWLRKAAVLGHAPSQYNLAILLYARNVKSDREEAKSWMKKAADSGYKLAIEHLQDKSGVWK